MNEDKRCQDGQDLLEAARVGDLEKLKRYLEEGANIFYQDLGGCTALHYAAGKKENTEVVRFLVNCGINPNTQSKQGNTALHVAVIVQRTKIVHLLISSAVDLNIQAVDGSTAHHYAARIGNTEIIHLLIVSGIKCCTQDKEGNTALHFASMHGFMEAVHLLIDSGIDPNMQAKNGNTALHIAVEKNFQWLVEALLHRKCDINIQNIADKKPKEMTNDKAITKLFQAHEKLLLSGLPLEVKKLDKKSAHVFSSLLGEESYPHFESRVMLVGEQGTGKTSIARFLVGKRPNRFRMSTNGIELYNGLSYMDRETKEWLGGQQDFSIEDITISRSLLHVDKRKNSVRLHNVTPTFEDLNIANDGTSFESETHLIHELLSSDVAIECLLIPLFQNVIML